MADNALLISQIRQRLEILYQMVDKLETGGGGQGGTDDYTQLENLPKLNSKIITGSHDSSYYGLADAAALEAKADKATTYTKEETNGEITGAIMDLDVESKGASDGAKYIGLVGQADGLLTAEAFTPALTIMANVSKPPTTDAVNSAINNAKTAANSYTDTQVATKTSINDVFGTGGNTYIPDAADLNTYTQAGVYIRQFSTGLSNFSNLPMDGTTYPYQPFKLVVEYINSANNIVQTLIPTYSNCGFFKRCRIFGASGTWQTWQWFGGEAVQPTTGLQSLRPDASLTVEPNGEVDV